MQRCNGLTTHVRDRQGAQPARGIRKLSMLALLTCALGAVGPLASAHAQSNPQQLADANRNAMEAYNNLDIEQAKAALEKAAKNAEKNGIRGPALARTYANLAVVLMGGLGDQKGATNAFARALREDPKVEPDPIVATPEIMAAYNAAKENQSEQAEPSEPAPAAKPARRAPPRSAPAAPEGNLEHSPPPEQLSQTAIPLFVGKSSELDIATVTAFYRSTGMRKPKSAELQETDEGYTYLIPCSDVFEPVVEYFLVAKDSDGNQVGNYGTPEAPVSVTIVTTRTQPAPSLPGQVPPAQCSADQECPPGMPGCSGGGGSAGLGDTCTQDSDCQSGLICSDDFCSMGEREQRDDERSSRGGKKRFFIDAEFGFGITSVREGRSPDRAPDPATVEWVVGELRRTGKTSEADADEVLQTRGWDCEPSFTPVENKLRPNKCTVAVDPPGAVWVPLIDFAAGYYVTPRVALALTGRLQLKRGAGPLAGVLLGARGEYLLTQPVEKGLAISLLAGFSVGQMQARPPPKPGKKESGPFATNALVGGVGSVISLGGKLAYRFHPNVGIVLTPAFQFGLPKFLFAFDASIGPQVAF